MSSFYLFTMLWPTIVIVIGALFSISSLLVDDPDKKKALLKIISIILIVSGAGASLWKELDDTEEKEIANKKLDEGFQNTLQAANTSIKKINLAIDSLQQVQRYSDSILKNTVTQLTLQNKSLKTSENLLKNNEEIINDQSDIFKNTDRLLTPLFPFDLGIIMTIPLENNPKLTELFDSLQQIREEVMNGIQHSSIYTLKFDRFRKIKSILFTSKIRKSFPKTLSMSDPLISANLNFSIYDQYSNHRLLLHFVQSDNSKLIADFKSKTITWKLFYHDYKLESNFANTATKEFGWIDLNQSIIEFNPKTTIKNYELKSFILSQKKGLNFCKIEFNKRDVFFERDSFFIHNKYYGMDSVVFKVYRHTITKNDFKLGTYDWFRAEYSY